MTVRFVINTLKTGLRHAARYVNRCPRLRRAAFAVLNRFPPLKHRLAAIVLRAPMSAAGPQSVPMELAHLTPRARQIHADLKSALARRQKGNG